MNATEKELKNRILEDFTIDYGMIDNLSLKKVQMREVHKNQESKVQKVRKGNVS